MRGVYLLSKPKEQGFDRMWLEMEVTTPSMGTDRVGLDPTATLYGDKGVETWSTANPDPGTNYEELSRQDAQKTAIALYQEMSELLEGASAGGL